MAGPAMMGGNRSKWRPNSAAAMNNNPMGVQSVMQPTAPPMAPTMPPRPVAPNPLPSANPGYGPPATTGGGPPTGNPPASNVPAVRPPGPPAVRPLGGPPALRPLIPGMGMTVSPLPSRGMVDQFAQTPYGQAAGMTPRPQPPAPLSPQQVPKINTAPVQDAAPPGQTFAGSAAGRQSGMGMMSPPQSAQAARASDLRQQTADSKWRMAQSAATPLAPTPPNRFFQPQGRDPQNPSQFDVRNVGPGGGYFVDRGGQTQPRQDTSMARNVMTGQPAEGSASFGQPMNIPGATQTFNGQTFTQPKVYNPGGGYGRDGTGVIPGSMPRLNEADETARAAGYREEWNNRKSGENVMSPDEYRVRTGGRAMIPFEPSGTIVSPEASAASRLAARESKMARSRGVRGSDVQLWRARRNAEMQQGVADGNAPVATAPNQGGIPVQPSGQQAAAPSPVATAPSPATPAPDSTAPGPDGVRRDANGQPLYGLQDWRNSWMGRAFGNSFSAAGRMPRPNSYGPKF